MRSLMIVEDEDMERRYLLKTAQKCFSENVEVYTAENGKEAIDLFLKVRPEVVISDIYMPVMDGLSLMEKIKEIEPDTICYILTSYDYFSYAQKAIQIGIEDFVLKPISRNGIQNLLDQANVILEKKNSNDAMIDRMHALEEKIEKDCFISIVMSADAAQLEENLHLLGLSGKEQSCAILCGNQNISGIRDRFAKQGLVSFSGQYEGRKILFVFSDGIFDACLFLTDLSERNLIQFIFLLSRAVRRN